MKNFCSKIVDFFWNLGVEGVDEKKKDESSGTFYAVFSLLISFYLYYLIFFVIIDEGILPFLFILLPIIVCFYFSIKSIKLYKSYNKNKSLIKKIFYYLSYINCILLGVFILLFILLSIYICIITIFM